MANNQKEPHWLELFSIRVLTFGALSFILMKVGTILHEILPEYTVTYASLAVGFFIASIFKAWES